MTAISPHDGPVAVTGCSGAFHVAAVLGNSADGMSVLGATIRPVEDTIQAVVETAVELGVIEPQLRDA